MPNLNPFLTADTARQAYEEAYKWLRLYDQPMDEFERIARNRPSPNIDPSLPKVTDGTLAAIIQESPKRIVQQIPSAEVYSDDHPDYAEVADIIFSDKLLPLYSRNGDMLQKSWNMLGKAMTYGVCASYTFFTSTNRTMHTDFIIPYIKDVLTEKGKVYGPDCNLTFLRSWYQKTDLQAIINREKSLQAADSKYTSEWDLKLLAQFIADGVSAKPAELQTPAQKEKGGDNGGYEVIHAFQKGVGAEFYSFAPRFKDGVCLRKKVNSDPRGKLPIDFLYCNIDLSNPRGRGQVELSGGVQNLIDQQMQMFQFMTTMMMAPPLQVWGGVNPNTLKFRPGAIWDMGQNPNGKVEPYVFSDQAIANFGNNYGLLKSQIMQLNNHQDTSISATSAPTPQQSKTPQGVQAQMERLGVSDNYLRKQFETWFRAQSETSINLYFSEMKGPEAITLNSIQLAELKAGPAAKFISGDKLKLNYSDINNVAFTLQVDAGTSEEQDDTDQLQKMESIMQEVGQNPLVINWFLGQAGKKLNMGELYTQRFERMKLKNLNTILQDMDDQEAQQAKQAPFPILDKPQVRLMGQDLPPAALVGALHQAGVDISLQDAMVPPALAQAKNQTDMQLKQMEQDLQNRPKDIREDIQLDKIYAGTTDPAIKAQIEALAGLNPDMSHLQNEVDTAEATHAADQADAHQKSVEAVRNILTPPADPNSPETIQAKAQATASAKQPANDPNNEASETPQQEAQESPQQEQQEIDQDFASAPLSPQEEAQVTQLLQQGMTEDQIEQLIMQQRQQAGAAQ